MLLKTICYYFIHSNSVSSSSSNAESICKPAYPVVSLSYSDSASAIHYKRKLGKNEISLPFVKSANSHDIANKSIVCRDRINVFLNLEIMYLQYFLSQHYFVSF